MSSLLVVVNEDDDLVFSTSLYNKDINMDLLVMAYGSLDTLQILMSTTTTNYFDSLQVFNGYTISAMIYPSFYKCLFISKNKKNRKKFMNEVHKIVKHKLICGIVEDRLDISREIQDIVNRLL